MALNELTYTPYKSANPTFTDPNQRLRGEPARYITHRELEILKAIGDALSTKEIAALLSISPKTVDAHVNHIYAKVGVRSRIALAIIYRDGNYTTDRRKENHR